MPSQIAKFVAAKNHTVSEKYTMELRSCSASDVQPYERVVIIVTALVAVGYVLTCGTEYRCKLFSQRCM
jgi:hypothetical protein